MADDWETISDLDAFTLETDKSPAVKNTGDWDDEEEAAWEDTKDWDKTGDDVPSPQPKTKPTTPGAKPVVLTKAQKRKQKEETEQRKKVEEEQRLKRTEEEIHRQKQEDLKRVKASDMEHALDLFGAAAPEAETKKSLLEVEPQSTQEFVELAANLANELKKLSGSEEFPNFVNTLTKQLCDIDDVSVEDVRLVIQTLNTLMSKKLKENKKGRAAKTPTSKGAKVNVKGGGTGGNFDDHKAGEFDDFLDFM